jgi:hypothetical protein
VHHDQGFLSLWFHDIVEQSHTPNPTKSLGAKSRDKRPKLIRVWENEFIVMIENLLGLLVDLTIGA